MVARQAGVVQGECEAFLRPRVHLFVFAVAGVQAQHMTVITEGLGVDGRTAERFGPVSRQPLHVVRMLTRMRERVTDHRILQASLVPGTGEIENWATATGGLVDRALHDDIVPAGSQRCLAARLGSSTFSSPRRVRVWRAAALDGRWLWLWRKKR